MSTTVATDWNERLGEEGRRRIRWAEAHLRLLRDLREDFGAARPFDGMTIGICLHIEPKTAVLCSVLQAGGADVVITGSPGTTQDDVATALAATGATVFGQRADDRARHLENVREVLRHRPALLLDNGADLVTSALREFSSHGVLAGTEETTAGATRLREELRGQVPFPVIVINDSPLKLIMENQHGVGQTVVEGFMRATNLLVPGKRFVVIGYGSCGRGIARDLHRLGGRVTIVEQDPIRALEAVLEGLRVAELEEAVTDGEVFFTVTGQPHVLGREQFRRMADGAILASAGHFPWEIDCEGLRCEAVASEMLSESIEQFVFPDGRRITLLAKGEMLNLAAGGGNPIEAMDLGLALQACSLRHLAERAAGLPAGPQPVPREISLAVARAMLTRLSA